MSCGRTASRYATLLTDREEQMILVLPKGWVFHEAENAAGFAKKPGARSNST